MYRKINITLIILFVVVLSGCMTYTFDGRNYSSIRQAEDAQQAYLDRVTTKVTPTKNPVGGKALVVLPSRSLIEKYGVVKTGYPSRDTIEFIVTSLDMNYKWMADVLRARNIFDEVVVRTDDKPETYTLPGYDAIIYLTLLSKDQAQWFLKLPQQNKEVPIFMDLSLTLGIERVTGWLNNIAKNIPDDLIAKKK